MLEQSFSKWLEKEVLAIKYALLVALEKRDNMLYIEAPLLREEYMQKIGIYEEQVLKNELEVSLLEKKKLLIQTALNRREPINLEEIEKQLEEERKQHIEQLNQNYKRSSVSSNLTLEEKEELQKLYKEIINDFHPEVHADMTEFQKKLYKRAMAAYQKQQLEELRLVHEMLYAKDAAELTLDLTFETSDISEMMEEDTEKIADQLTEDYSLAAELFGCFELLEEDGILLSAKQQYEAKEKDVWSEIEQINMEFPFIAKETLQNEELTKEYLNSLENRMNSCNESMTELQSQIAEMLGV